jgi:hypothetical protein
MRKKEKILKRIDTLRAELKDQEERDDYEGYQEKYKFLAALLWILENDTD